MCTVLLYLIMDEKNLLATRDGWGDALVELGKTDKRVVVLTADLKESTRVERFAGVFPERFVECGVAEQNMMGMAAGLAAAGKIPFVSSYAVFSPGRNWDQLRVSVCYSNLPVVVGGHHTGVAVGPDGATHQGLEDIAITRCLPNMTVVVPADYEETRKAVKAAVDAGGPVYIRLTKEKTTPITDRNAKFETGKAQILFNSGSDAAIIGCGPILYECLLAARQLESEGTGVKVVNNHTVKPMDRETIIAVAKECGVVVTAEDHQVAGGMGSAVAEFLISNYPVPMEFVGVKDSFGESGTPDELAEKYGLKAKDIVQAVKKVMGRKK